MGLNEFLDKAREEGYRKLGSESQGDVFLIETLNKAVDALYRIDDKLSEFNRMIYAVLKSKDNG